MVNPSIIRSAKPRMIGQGLHRTPVFRSRPQWTTRSHNSRGFSSSSRYSQKHTGYKDSFGTRLRRALGETKIKWYPIPVALGIGFLGFVQFNRINEREKANQRQGEIDGESTDGRPKRRERIRPTGPWFVKQIS